MTQAASSTPSSSTPGPRRSSPARRSRAQGRRRDAPYIAERSLLRTVQRERTVALSGGRALFMQAAHPVAFAGFFATSAALDNPYPRLARTSLAVNTVIYGSEAQAREVQDIVGGMHARVRGRMRSSVGPFPAGTPYRGDDPDLLLWILAAFIDSSYGTYERYVRPLSDAERQELWEDWRKVGEIFGLVGDAMPATYEEHRAYVEGMLTSGLLVVSDEARDLSRRVILNPPIPLALLPIKELVNQITIDALPGDLRQQYGFVPIPGRGLGIWGFEQWVRRIGRPLAPDAVRQVADDVMPSPERSYADIVRYVNERFGG